MYVLAPNQTVETFPYSIGDLRRDNPGTSFPRNPSPELLADWSVYPVTAQEPPSLDPATQRLAQASPELVNGEWRQAWNVVALTAEEAADRTEQEAQRVRSERNRLLSESDWTQLADAPVDGTAWSSYRQALRDLPQQDGFPWNVQWPESVS